MQICIHILHFMSIFILRPFSNYVCEWELVLTDFLIKSVDTGTAGALTDTQQLLLPIQSLNQSNLLPSALQSVLLLAFYTSSINVPAVYFSLQGGCRLQPSSFISFILEEGSNRYMNYSLSLDHFSSFPKIKVYLEFSFCLFQIVLYSQRKRNSFLWQMYLLGS